MFLPGGICDKVKELRLLAQVEQRVDIYTVFTPKQKVLNYNIWHTFKFVFLAAQDLQKVHTLYMKYVNYFLKILLTGQGHMQEGRFRINFQQVVAGFLPTVAYF